MVVSKHLVSGGTIYGDFNQLFVLDVKELRMDTIVDQSKSVTARTVSFTTIIHSMKNGLGWVKHFFTLSEEERAAAGIRGKGTSS